MKTKKIAGQSYIVYPNGVLVPETLVREIGVKVSFPSQVVPLFSDIAFSPVECSAVVTLDGANQVIKKHDITKGLVNSCSMHPREMFRVAILDNACSIVIAHNHPSGQLEASEADLIATRRMVEVAKTIGIPVLDHLIVSSKGFVSLREKYPNYFG